ncbi:MAG: phosphodiester glycosidase family protein [Chloroflexi bacterium]|nr:phosphodiester glycosidase family protein [Chloroflexota bacterium]MCC6893638.1 phosphodiester glycosidase family protein [Anaerolineae bacterium]
MHPTKITLFTLVLFLLGGCFSRFELQPVATSQPAPTVTVSSGWQTLAAGLERRNYDPDPLNPVTRMVALRIDPVYYTFRAHYQPGQAYNTSEWALNLSTAVAFVNANFFDPSDMALGLVVADGTVFGQSYTDRGGTFLVQNGQPRLRSNLREPYQGEALEQAVQAFPMLVLDGAAAFHNEIQDSSTRRTVIAQDSSGRIILLATPLLGLTLRELSAYLPTTDMDIVTAFNLDGGRSTMMGLKVGGSPETVVSAFDEVPTVLAVYAR